MLAHQKGKTKVMGLICPVPRHFEENKSRVAWKSNVHVSLEVLFGESYPIVMTSVCFVR